MLESLPCPIWFSDFNWIRDLQRGCCTFWDRAMRVSLWIRHSRGLFPLLGFFPSHEFQFTDEGCRTRHVANGCSYSELISGLRIPWNAERNGQPATHQV